ncbi:MAG: MBL fold metallo-hydrolase [Ignavibacteria bacterium]|nr:MBL fold metallo-hydrolase [Ignavibacteria bacterium]
MKKTISYIIIIIFISLIISGCAGFSILTKNIGRTISTPPEKVKFKISKPVKDNIKLSALWIGHSSVLLQIYDKVILFDPFFENSLVGVFTRIKEAGLDRESISKLDYIFISHSHIDHLHFNSIGYFESKFPKTHLIYPEGTEYYLPDFDFPQTRIKISKALSNYFIGDSQTIDGIKITPVYALHTGGRYALDTYLWKVQGHIGYIIEYKEVCIYYAGDTGYHPEAFKVIGKNFKINLAFIPLGPCLDCDGKGFKYHTSSIEGLDLMKDVNAEFMLPIHYGAIEYFRDANFPLESMKTILQREDYTGLKNKIIILNEGNQIVFENNLSEYRLVSGENQ